MNIADLKYNLVLNFKNIPGATVAKKIVVIEADDYGGIRMPSAEASKKLQQAGIPSLDSRYNKFDTLENKTDLEFLFETLNSVKDADGHAAVLSPFVNVANPDFEKIKSSGYHEYFYEPFTTTLQKYNRDAGTMLVWRQGMQAGIFTPQFHGREHISVQPWLEQLQAGNRQLLAAFENGFVSVGNITGIHDYAQEFRPEFYFTKDTQKPFLHQSISEGVAMFEKLFGYTPAAFMPSNSVFHPDFEPSVFQSGIKFLVVAHKNLTPAEEGNPSFTNFTFRQKIKPGKLNYYIRNCAFEPNDEGYKNIDGTMLQVAAAFKWKKPAIISTHRVNFAGALSEANRDSGLMELKKLLQAIVKRWPDVTFMSTANMLQSLR
jgi:hypothetical protein